MQWKNKVLHNWSIEWERWSSPKKGQQCGKHFHSMTSSCVPNFLPRVYRAPHIRKGVSQGYSYKIAWLAATKLHPRLQTWVQAVCYFPSTEILQDLISDFELPLIHKTDTYTHICTHHFHTTMTWIMEWKYFLLDGTKPLSHPMLIYHQLEHQRSEETHHHPMITHIIDSYWIKTRESQSFKFKEFAKIFQIFDLKKKFYTQHIFWICLIRYVNIKWI